MVYVAVATAILIALAVKAYFFARKQLERDPES